MTGIDRAAEARASKFVVLRNNDAFLATSVGLELSLLRVWP
jgi:hypothetical protein